MTQATRIKTNAQHRQPPRMPLAYIIAIGIGAAICPGALVGITHAQAAADSDSKSLLDFSRDIKPIFIEHCYQCHGPDKQKGKFRLDQRAAAFKGGESGPIIKPGKPDQSLLIKMITSTDPDSIMPPRKKGKPLNAKQKKLLGDWIAQGATWPQGKPGMDHWAYQPIKSVQLPKPTNTATLRNPIDAFVLARLEAKDIKPNPQADRYTLIKRLYYDLLGLPPTPEQVNAFINDKSPKAYESLVEQLLESPHFGERWGRHWLDKARYADSDGYEKDRPRNNAWRYRDWVIDAINKDMPFDQFTIEQLAGDLLPNATPMQKLATAFHRQTLTNTEGGTDKEQFRVEAVFDRTETTGTVWLGMTMLCARCHTHKYDAITQTEYYQLFAFYDNGDETNTNVPKSQAAITKYEREKTKHDKSIAQLQSQISDYRKQAKGKLPAWEKQIQRQLASAPKNKIQFHDLQIINIKGPNGVSFKPMDDGSYLVTGPTNDKAKYTITAATKTENITGIRLDVLPDKSLPAKGPGRAPNGNFVLSEIRFYATDQAKVTSKHNIKIVSAKANFSQGKFLPRGAFDRSSRTGWAVAPQMGHGHWAYFTVAKPINFKNETRLQIVLDQQYGGKHNIGRFKISAMTGTEPGLLVPGNIGKILATSIDKRDSKQTAALLDYYITTVDHQGSKLLQQFDALKKKAPKAPTMSVRVIAQRSSPRTTKVLHRGDFLDPKNSVKANTLSVLPPIKPRKPNAMADRLDLATWLVDSHNPLTPRVTANHIWTKLFGQGLVRTINDFGVRGKYPTHPKLLDWLGLQLVQRGWSRKAFIKLIVNSATYRQSSRHRPELFESDPENLLLHRQNRFRVEAEIVRDINLAAAGLLSQKVGGPSVFPPMPKNIASLSYANSFKWKESKGEDRYRRGMYTFFKRTSPHPNLIAFDCPSSNVTNVRRTMSNTPLQALTTLNNLVFVEASQALAKRVLENAQSKTDAQKISYAFSLCVARPPTDAETAKFTDLLQSGRQWYKEHQDDAKKLLGAHTPNAVAIHDAAAWVATARIMMNMDEMLTRE